MAEKKRAPTVRNVAEKAGVSAMTVSNVINRPEKVSPGLVERVREAMIDLGFVPNASARVLTSNRSPVTRSGIIALVYPSNDELLANQHDAAFLGAVEHHVSRTGRHLMIWPAKDAVQTAEKLRSWQMDGAIFYGTLGSEIDKLHELLDVPMVFVDNYSESPRVVRVNIDDERGGLLAARRLLEAGHRRLGFVGPISDDDDGVVGERFRGFGEATDDVPIHDVGVVYERYRGFAAAVEAVGGQVEKIPCNPRFEDGRARAVKLSSNPGRPTGLFATADIIAIGLLKGFQNSHIKVPDQVSLIGFDDILEAGHVVPELTTIRQDIDAKARVAVERLGGLIEPDSAPSEKDMPEVKLIERDTVGPPPS
jgi:LacI family transcriptional regulator, galactose operon repressor